MRLGGVQKKGCANFDMTQPQTNDSIYPKFTYWIFIFRGVALCATLLFQGDGFGVANEATPNRFCTLELLEGDSAFIVAGS